MAYETDLGKREIWPAGGVARVRYPPVLPALTSFYSFHRSSNHIPTFYRYVTSLSAGVRLVVLVDATDCCLDRFGRFLVISSSLLFS